MRCFGGCLRSMLGASGRLMRLWRLFMTCARTLPTLGALSRGMR